MPAIAWNANQYEWGVIWEDRPSPLTFDQIFFQRTNRNGVLVGSVVQVTSGPGNQHYLQITSTGSAFGLLWLDQSVNQAAFVRLDGLGQPSSPKLTVSGNVVGSIASDGTNFMTVYQPGTSRKISCQ